MCIHMYIYIYIYIYIFVYVYAYIYNPLPPSPSGMKREGSLTTTFCTTRFRTSTRAKAYQ